MTKPVVRRSAGPQRRNRKPQIALFAVGRGHFDFPALRERPFGSSCVTPPDFRDQIAEEFPRGPARSGSR